MTRGPVVCVLLMALVVACQPAGEPALDPADGAVGQSVEGEDAVGAPARGMPGTLAGLVERGRVPAQEWQPDPRLVEVWVALDEEQRPARANLTYVAADADRLLVVRVDGDGVSLEQPTLRTLQLAEVSAAGLDAIPELPDGVLDPTALAEAAEPALDECDLSAPVRTVVYATGAPMSWDGQRWTAEPQWTANLLVEDGGTVVDPADGAGTGACFTD
jgi:hypothetical protein